MAGLKLLTDLDLYECIKLAWRSAQDQGYSIPPLSDGDSRFTATKGSLVVGALAGALAPYCRFDITATAYPDANEVVLQKNKPWLTAGLGGVRTVNRQAADLMQAIVSAIQKAGGKILDLRDF